MTTTTILIDDVEPYEFIDGFIHQNGEKVAHSINGCYLQACITLKTGVTTTISVHRLVAAKEYGCPLRGDRQFQVDHINSVKQDNRPENLRLVSASENTRRAHDWKYSDDTDTHKKCRQCSEVKPRFEFHKDAGKRDGLKLKCKSCTKEYHANNR